MHLGRKIFPNNEGSMPMEKLRRKFRFSAHTIDQRMFQTIFIKLEDDKSDRIAKIRFLCHVALVSSPLLE